MFAEQMSTTFLHIVAGRLIETLKKEVEKMIDEIQNSRDTVKIYQKKKK